MRTHYATGTRLGVPAFLSVDVHDTQESWTDRFATCEQARRALRDYQNAEYNLKRAQQGDARLVGASDVLMEQLTDLVELDTYRKRTRRAVTGSAPHIPGYLAGDPASMLRRTRVADERGPVAVLFNPSTAWAISGETVRRRGAAALALVRLLSATRPVSLWVTYACCGFAVSQTAMRAARAVTGETDIPLSASRHTTGYAYRIAANPLDLARAAVHLTCPEFFRSVHFAGIYGSSGSTVSHSASLIPFMGNRELLNTGAAALFAEAVGQDAETYINVPINSGTDTEFESLENAAKWVRRTYTQHMETLTHGAA